MRITPAMRKKYPNHPHIRNPRGPRRPTPLGHGHPGRKPRKPRPISTGPKTGRRPPRKLTTSQAAIRRFEALKRQRAGGNTGRGQSKPLPGRKPWGRQGGPRTDARPTGGGRRTSRTSQIAINRSKNRLGPTPSRGRRRR